MPRCKYFTRLVSILLLLCLMIFAVLKIDDRLRLIATNYAKNRAKIVANAVINETVSRYLDENEISYSDLVKINSTGEGRVTSVEFDTVALTKLKAGIITNVQNVISDRELQVLNVPIGTLTGNQYLNNRGPTLHIEFKMSSAVFSKISSAFSSAGINQTLHKITLDIKAEIYFVMPWYRTSGEFETDFLLAETVIVGEVPDAYTNVIEKVGSDLAGDLFDFAAGIN
ncbi:MAG: sporulation protein YunB [Ruminococcaceae bacterium]|nr:sporulation protein YunB [Oscillospiraceae bacterium]